MGDEEDSGPLLVEDVEGLVADAVAQAVVEAGEGLVHQQDRRPRRQRAGERDALLLAAGEFVRKAAGMAAEPDPLEQAAHPRRLPARPGEPEGDVARRP